MISVIIPIYNVEECLRHCVDSVISQKFTDLEIILVDDGSTDGCPGICDEYAKADSRIKVIHKPNGGLMSAWKCGLSQACGEYIGFVDSDDWIDEDMYETLYSLIRDTGADIVTASLIREFDDRSEKERVFPAQGYYDRAQIEAQIYPRLISMGTMMDRFITPNRVTKLFKAELLRRNAKYCDERISLGEDFVAVFSCLCDAQSIYITDSFFPYHYRIRGTSIMGAYNPKFYRQSVLLNETLRAIAKDKDVYDFSSQLDNDLISLAFYGIERNIFTAKCGKKELVGYIRDTVSDSSFISALKRETVSRNNKKCLMYKLILKTVGAGALYTFIKRVVFFKRRHLGY